MASNISTLKSTHLAAAFQAGKEYPEIYTSYEDWMNFHSDFMMLVRILISERVGGDPRAALRDITKNGILTRDTTKKYNAKAQTNGRPTFSTLAAEQAKDKTTADVDREMEDFEALSDEGLRSFTEYVNKEAGTEKKTPASK